MSIFDIEIKFSYLGTEDKEGLHHIKYNIDALIRSIFEVIESECKTQIYVQKYMHLSLKMCDIKV